MWPICIVSVYLKILTFIRTWPLVIVLKYFCFLFKNIISNYEWDLISGTVVKGSRNLPSHNTDYIRLRFYLWIFSVLLILFYMFTLYINTVVWEGTYGKYVEVGKGSFIFVYCFVKSCS